jgi:acetyl-CoA carboxylase biotin carboxyl carrier protein
MLTFEQIKELIDIVCQKGLQGLEVERSDFRLRIDGQVPSPNMPATGAEAPGVGEPAAERSINSGTSDAVAAQATDNGSHTITSPIVGTFYAAPSPEADPYIQVGDEVTSGQVLCIVEAMKLMNEIESDIDGVVVEVYGRNSQPVEFGEPLFAIRPA